jgi:hypothetical protein
MSPLNWRNELRYIGVSGLQVGGCTTVRDRGLGLRSELVFGDERDELVAFAAPGKQNSGSSRSTAMTAKRVIATASRRAG